jgi:hypothetical protein
VLDRVADLVGRNRRRADGIAREHRLREVHPALLGVVVVRERPAGRLVHRHLVEAVGVEDGAGDLRTGHAVHDLDLGLLGEGLLEPPLDGQADDQRGDQERDVEAEASHCAES